MIELAKKDPGKVRYTSAGIGSFPHYDMEVFARRAGVTMNHIPNKTGAAGMINDLVVGDAQVAFLNAASSAAMIKAGKLRPVAVIAEKRLADYPDVPTLAEAGLAGYEANSWQSMVAPANVLAPIVAALNQALTGVLAEPATREHFLKLGIQPMASTPEEFRDYIRAEIQKWAPIIKAAGATED